MLFSFAMRALENDVWLYEGPPDQVGLSVPDASLTEGGYVIVCELENSELRMFATRFPTKCVANWNNRSRRYSGASLKHVLVSIPMIRYERAKRLLIDKLAEEPGEHMAMGQADAAPVTALATVKKQAEMIFSVKTVESTNVIGYLQGHP